MEDARRLAPATARNRDPVLTVLREVLPASGLVLEVAAGSGEHALHFARALPDLTWQPTDPAADALASICAWRASEALPNLLPPLQLDAALPDWPIERADAVVCINMTHISDWAATVGLFMGCSRLLPPGGPIVIYGPFHESGVETAQSNLEFDRSLKDRNPNWGLRDAADVDRAGSDFGFSRADRVAMPANNLILVYRRSVPGA